MFISEMQEILEEKKKEYGDIDIEYTYNDEGYMLLGSTSVNGIDVEETTIKDWDSEGNQVEKKVHYLVLF